MILHPVFVATDLTVELVHQLIDRGVQIFIALFDEDVLALHMQRDLGLLSAFLLLQLLYRQQHSDVDHLVEVSCDPVQLG